ncbi:MAG: hypothetical protein RLN96_09795 [Pseudomonadales bacterium]
MAGKKKDKKKPKNSQLIIRINRLERDRFLDLCEESDTTAAREIRKFIRKFVKKNKDLVDD